MMLEEMRNNVKKVLPWVGIIGIIYTMTLLQIPMIFRNIFLVLTTTCCFGFLWKGNRKNGRHDHAVRCVSGPQMEQWQGHWWNCQESKQERVYA